MVSHSERVLITGGTGFTGRPLRRRLCREGWKVFTLSHERSSGETGGDDTLVADLCDFDAVTEALTHVNPNAIVHLAGTSAPSSKKIGEIYFNNVVGTANLFAAIAAAKLKPRIIIVASSSHVYASSDTNGPLTEDSYVKPWTHYAVSKHATEEIAALHSHHLPVIVARPFNYTGPGQTTNFLVPKIVQQYAERRREMRVGNLDQYRDFSDITRVVEAYARLLTPSIDPTTVNICSGRPFHLLNIIKIMDEIAGYSMQLVTDKALLREGEPRSIVGSPQRLEHLVGPLPSPEFRETLMRMYVAYSQPIRSVASEEAS